MYKKLIFAGSWEFHLHVVPHRLNLSSFSPVRSSPFTYSTSFSPLIPGNPYPSYIILPSVHFNPSWHINHSPSPTSIHLHQFLLVYFPSPLRFSPLPLSSSPLNRFLPFHLSLSTPLLSSIPLISPCIHFSSSFTPHSHTPFPHLLTLSYPLLLAPHSPPLPVLLSPA